MHIWGLTEQQIHDAMHAVQSNGRYPGAIFNREPEKYGRAYRCTIKMQSVYSDGAVSAAFWNGEQSYSGRSGSYASWHVHGHFMAEIFRRNPEARIKSAGGDIRGVGEFFDHYPPARAILDAGEVTA